MRRLSKGIVSTVLSDSGPVSSVTATRQFSGLSRGVIRRPEWVRMHWRT